VQIKNKGYSQAIGREYFSTAGKLRHGTVSKASDQCTCSRVLVGQDRIPTQYCSHGRGGGRILVVEYVRNGWTPITALTTINTVVQFWCAARSADSLDPGDSAAVVRAGASKRSQGRQRSL
jgi:hypothetical protein